MKQSTKNMICYALFGVLLIRNFQLMKERDFWKSQAPKTDLQTPMIVLQ